MQYRILKIDEDDYGCEGVPEGQGPMCSVLIQDADGTEHWIKLSDAYLTENHLDEGDTTELSLLE
ncbi:hypothetical protein [uncultured Ruminococcus sp.]|uniref:hypothetical protein n=1 Tax=uncultured Ruminococcus sp. TaxID=165186 RepID=UPI0026053183|nr:hypothetical protein [uncultured Ruminococcus sp.]